MRQVEADGSTVRVRFETAGDAARAVVAELILALGVRITIPVDRLDELSIAVDVLLRAGTGPLTVQLRPLDGGLEVEVEPVDGARLRRDAATVRGLADRFSSDGDAVTVAAGA